MKTAAKPTKGKPLRAAKIPVRKKTPLPTRPAQPPVPLPGIILRQLKSLSAGVLAASWLQGFLWTLIAVCTMLLLQGSLDWLLDLSWRARLLLLILDFAVFGWLVYFYLVRAVQKKLTPEQAALRAEKRFPALRTSLISAVQLAKSPEGSPKMVEALIKQVADSAQKIKFQSAVSYVHLRKYLIVAVVLGAAVAGAWFGFSPRSGILFQRMLLRNVPLPTQTIVEAISGDFSIAAGQTIEFSARAKGVIPRTGHVEITYEGQATQSVPVTPKPSSPDTFSMTLPNVQQPLTYRFYLNDGRGEEYKVSIFHDPVLQSVTFEQTYPAYTGLAKTQQAAGNLTLLAGSKLHVQAKADQPLKSAHFQLKGVEQNIEMTVGPDGSTISGDISVPAKGLEGFSIVTQNMQGYESQSNTLYRVELVPDNPPEISFADGTQDEQTVVEDVHPRIQFQVRDDFQVKEVYLCCEIPAPNSDAATAAAAATPDKPLAPTVKKIPIEVPKAAPSLSFNFEWKNPAESGIWKPGNTVNYWIEAVDNNDVTGPGITDSTKHSWKVVTLAEKRKELTDKLRQQAEEIENLAGKQKELQNDTGDLIKKK